MRTNGWIATLAGVIGVSVGVGVAFACSVAPTPRPFPGIPGLQRLPRRDAGEAAPIVPRNVALVGAPLIVDGIEIALVDLDVPSTPEVGPFRAADELLPVGSSVGDPAVWHVDGATVGDYEDHIAPDVPLVTGGRIRLNESSSCREDSADCSVTTINLTVGPSQDDHTPSENVIFAVYISRTRDGARTMPQPTEILVRDRGEVWAIVNSSFETVPVFVSVAAIDFAANHSERSEPIRVHNGDTGCAVTRAGRAHIATWILLGLSVVLVAFRKRKVALPQSS